MIEEAIKFAGEAHRDDRWSGLSYLTHLALTAERVRQSDGSPQAVGVAWLHDVLEDHPAYEGRLKEEFPELYDHVVVLTRSPEEDYDAFIDRIVASGDPIAIAVKEADMRTNLDGDPPIRLWQRYSRNIGKLTSALD